MFERFVVAVTPQRIIDRERRVQHWAFVQATATRYNAVDSASQKADRAMTAILKAVKTDDLQGVQNACAEFESVLAPFAKQTGKHHDATKDDGLDATQLRGAWILRLVNGRTKPDRNGAIDLNRLRTLHQHLEKLQSNGCNDTLITHLAIAVKAELLRHAMADITLTKVQKETNSAARANGLQDLIDMGSFAKDIHSWMAGSDDNGKPRYGNAIPGSSLTLGDLATVIVQAADADAIQKADAQKVEDAIRTDAIMDYVEKAPFIDLSKAPLEDLRDMQSALDWLMQTQHQTPTDQAACQKLHDRLSASITDRLQKITAARTERQQKIAAAHAEHQKKITAALPEFHKSLKAALQVKTDRLVPTELLRHAVEAGKAMATLAQNGTTLTREECLEAIQNTFKGVHSNDLKRLQMSLHYGDCKWMLFELNECGTVRAKAAQEHLSMVKSALDTLLSVPNPPANPMLRMGRAPLPVADAFRVHPFPLDEDL
ncbi:MAG: hypothetical protein Q7T95_00300 [Hydrogenophaga sp.]|nr:hypothetical protein [Hydrogenophaga sp.]